MQKFENNIPFHTFKMKEFSSVFDEVKLAFNVMKMPNIRK